MNLERKRNYSIDGLRGVAIGLMLFHHFVYILAEYKKIEIDMLSHPFWSNFPKLIIFIFLFTSGISLSLSMESSFKVKSYLKRLIKLLLGAIFISGYSYLLFPDKWIYFGILHCILFCNILVIPFLRLSWVALFIAVIIFLIPFMFKFEYPWFLLPQFTYDYEPPLPWFGAMLLGVFFNNVFFKSRQGWDKKDISGWGRWLAFLGRHSFLIYLVHYPVILTVLYFKE
jgi:uncharacterized membrane protein